MTTPPHRPVVAVVGATGTGKSELALMLAERLLAIGQQVEIVNADAMQLYRGMDIGTAKLPVAARRGVAHHLLDVLDVTQEASVAAYQRHAREAIAGILERGHLPLLVGGSGLYVRAVLDHLDIPPTDAAPGPRRGRRRRHRTAQRPAHRASARGHRAHRATVLGEPAAP